MTNAVSSLAYNGWENVSIGERIDKQINIYCAHFSLSFLFQLSVTRVRIRNWAI